MNKREITVYLAFILMNICTWFLVIVNKDLFYWTKIATAVLFLVSFMFQIRELHDLIKSIAFISFMLLIFRNCGDDILLYFGLAMITIRNVKIDTIAKIDIFVKAVCMLLIFTLRAFNYIPNYDLYVGGRIRHSFGYYNPNNLFLGIFIICLDLLILYRGRLSKKIIALIIILGAVFGIMTYCRTGIIVLSVTVLFSWLQEKYNIVMNKVVSTGLTFIAPILLTLSLLLINLFSRQQQFAMALSNLITGRIDFAGRFLKQYGYSLLGQKIELNTSLQSSMNGRMAMSLDNFYIYSIIVYGLVFTAIIMYMHIKTQKKLISKGYYISAIILASIAVYSLNERIFISFEICPWVILMGNAFTENDIFIGRELYD